MTSIELNPERPSEAIIRAASASVSVKDAIGRQITVRRLKALDRMRICELVGAENAANDRYYGYAALAYSVSEIDGEPTATLSTKAQLEALVQRLDDEGLDAVGQAIKDNFSPKDNGSDSKDAVKNG
jgi:hypothetical protein